MLVWILFYFGIFDIYIGIRDICPKTISGYLNKITKGYGIFVVNYFRNGILGPHPTPPKQTSMISPVKTPGRQNANIPDHLAWPNRKYRTSDTMLG